MEDVFANDYDDGTYLQIQGKRDFENDLNALKMGGIEDYKELNVLDIGCNTADVTLNLLEYILPTSYDACSLGGIIEIPFKYTGIDYDETAIETAKKNYPSDTFYVGDIYEDAILEKIAKDKEYNVIILSQVLMHVANPMKLLKICYNLLSRNGMIYIKTVEDGMKMCHPHEELLQRILELYQEHRQKVANYTPDGFTDRFCGHKVYTMLKDIGFWDIKHQIAHKDTVGADYSERMIQYDQSFSFRLSKKMDDATYEEMKFLLREMKEAFRDDNFYYTTPVFYYTAHKSIIGDITNG